MRQATTVVCKSCSTGFRPRRHTAVYCSRTCTGAAKRARRITVKCITCGKDFAKHRSWFFAGRRHFCSRECQGVARRTENWWLHDGYRLKRTNGRMVRQHIHVAEGLLGRKLGPDECVHHVNGDRSDNRPGNLLVCTRSYHNWLHWEMSRRYQGEHFSDSKRTVSADRLASISDVLGGDA